jgi:AcrR family transcriptional regulator
MRGVEATSVRRGDRTGVGRDSWKASQRPRIVAAITQLASTHGYAATTVREIARQAGVSLTTFYEHFPDKETCFLDACDERATDLLEALYTLGAEHSWTDALRKGMRLYLASWADQPVFATAYLVELPAAGRRALQQRDRVHARFTAMFEALAERARTEQPRLPPLPELAAPVLSTGITEVVGQFVRSGRTTELPSHEDELVYLTIRFLADKRTADRERRRAGAGAIR